jgi:hypothetical protein
MAGQRKAGAIELDRRRWIRLTPSKLSRDDQHLHDVSTLAVTVRQRNFRQSEKLGVRGVLSHPSGLENLDAFELLGMLKTAP